MRQGGEQEDTKEHRSQPPPLPALQPFLTLSSLGTGSGSKLRSSEQGLLKQKDRGRNDQHHCHQGVGERIALEVLQTIVNLDRSHS